ncbi:MAG: sensor histidine kinase, partial [Fidelibacterota bacterium]
LAGQAATAIKNAQLYENLQLAYNDLRIAKEQIINTEKMIARGTMAAEIGHELNNYLTALSGRIQLMYRQLSKKAPELASSMKSILVNLCKMESFARGLMEFSGLKANKVKSDINKLIEDLLKFITPLSRFGRAKFSTSLESDLPMAEVDPGQIQQVFLNLYTNAVEAFPEAAIKTSTEYNAEAGIISITVEDDGPGISGEISMKVFEPRYSTKDGGHGFGLSICKKIIEDHKGSIILGKRKEGGTAFYITLPAAS